MDNSHNIESTSTTEIKVAHINCVGQSGLNLAKQLEIQSYLITNTIDILRLQECCIYEDTFTQCGYITSNYNIFSNNTPNKNNYGTASIVRCDLEVTNIHTDDSGRVIVFDTADCTWTNLYLPSGTAANHRALREHYSSVVIPELMISRLAQGAVGGDLNCIISNIDCSRDPKPKTSPSLRNLVSTFSWIDSYRSLYPRVRQYYRYYSHALQGEGATIIKRSYHWGNLKTKSAEYVSISFSDHLSLKITYILPCEVNKFLAPWKNHSSKSPQV